MLHPLVGVPLGPRAPRGTVCGSPLVQGLRVEAGSRHVPTVAPYASRGAGAGGAAGPGGQALLGHRGRTASSPPHTLPTAEQLGGYL